MLALIRGAGDIASGAAMRLWRCGINIVMTDLERPTAIRRTVAFSDAIVHGETTVEGLRAVRAENAAEAKKLLREGSLPVLADPECACREELARVQSDVIDRFAGRDFIFLPVSRGEARSAVETFRIQKGYDFPMGLDSAQSVYGLYATNFIPRNFLIDREGNVVQATIGYEPEEFDALIANIEKTLEK